VVLLPLFLIPTVAGVLTAVIVLRWPSVDPASPRVARKTALTVGHELVDHRGVRRFIDDRTNPAVATGLLLTAALGVAILGGLLLGALALLVRSNSGIVTIDHDISQWANDHTTQFAHDVLTFVTNFGATEYVVGAAVLVLVVEYRRLPSRWILPFLAVILIGQSLLTNGIKAILDRARPTLNPTAHFLGPSFPSGHTATAAAFWLAVALLMGRSRGRRAHGVLFGAAVAIGVAVACSRVLLDVHWFSDVIGGLALGWSWFALCSIAFGGRLLRFGAPVEIAERALATTGASSVPTGSTHAAGPPVGIEYERMEEVEQQPRRS
jgi:membrane-associated phospholipid phosphatase